MTIYQTMSIEELIAALAQHTDSLPVYFDWCWLQPTKPRSYRGDYSHLALGFETDGGATVGQVRGWLHEGNYIF